MIRHQPLIINPAKSAHKKTGPPRQFGAGRRYIRLFCRLIIPAVMVPGYSVLYSPTRGDYSIYYYKYQSLLVHR
jgi:hypothetical protein